HYHLRLSVKIGVGIILLLQVWPHAYRSRSLLLLAVLLMISAAELCEPTMNKGRKAYITLLVIGTAVSLGLSIRHVFPFRWYIRLFVALVMAYLTMMAPFELQKYYKGLLGFPTPPEIALPGILLLLISLVIVARPLF